MPPKKFSRSSAVAAPPPISLPSMRKETLKSNASPGNKSPSMPRSSAPLMQAWTASRPSEPTSTTEPVRKTLETLSLSKNNQQNHTKMANQAVCKRASLSDAKKDSEKFPKTETDGLETNATTSAPVLIRTSAKTWDDDDDDEEMDFSKGPDFDDGIGLKPTANEVLTDDFEKSAVSTHFGSTFGTGAFVDAESFGRPQRAHNDVWKPSQTLERPTRFNNETDQSQRNYDSKQRVSGSTGNSSSRQSEWFPDPRVIVQEQHIHLEKKVVLKKSNVAHNNTKVTTTVTSSSTATSQTIDFEYLSKHEEIMQASIEKARLRKHQEEAEIEAARLRALKKAEELANKIVAPSESGESKTSESKTVSRSDVSSWKRPPSGQAEQNMENMESNAKNEMKLLKRETGVLKESSPTKDSSMQRAKQTRKSLPKTEILVGMIHDLLATTPPTSVPLTEPLNSNTKEEIMEKKTIELPVITIAHDDIIRRYEKLHRLTLTHDDILQRYDELHPPVK